MNTQWLFLAAGTYLCTRNGCS